MTGNRPNLARRRIALVLPVLVFAPSAPALAQDWLKRGIEILEELGRKPRGSGLSTEEIILGLREALRVGTVRTIARVGRLNGYFLDDLIHIPLPRSLAKAQDVLRPLGMSGLLDDVERRLNRAAEIAAPKAKSLFFQAISSMTIFDAVDILRGPDNAATQYFRRTMGPGLKDTFRPIVNNELESAGAFRSLETVIDRASGFPIGGQVSGQARQDLVEHGLEFALDGLFHYLAEEERAIRRNPIKRTTEILKKVFA